MRETKKRFISTPQPDRERLPGASAHHAKHTKRARGIAAAGRSRRWALLLPALLALFWLSLAPAQAQTGCETTDIWCATLTVEEITLLGVVTYGYGYSTAGSLDAGSVSDDDFSYDDDDYEVKELAINIATNPTLLFLLNPIGTTVFNSDDYTLVVGGDEFSFDDATVNASNYFEWRNSNLSWSDGDTLTVRLVKRNHAATGKPTISGEALTGQRLTAETDAIEDENGLDDVDFDYQWVRVDGSTETEISGAVFRRYRLTDDDEGKQVKVVVTFQGFEADRATLKYRCPAAARGSICEGRERCHRRAGCRPGAYGRIVRVPLAHDRRIFTPTPYGSPSWHRGYRRRSALERIYNRIDHDFGFERHFVRGQARLQARTTLAGRRAAYRRGGKRPAIAGKRTG